MNGIIQDLKYGWRTLAKSPGFTAVAVLTLALGIGGHNSILSLINAVLLRPLPFDEPDRLVMVWERRASSNDSNLPVSGHEFVAWREQGESFEKIAIFTGDGFTLTGAGDPASINAVRASSDFFSVLGVEQMLGSAFSRGEDQTGSEPVVVLNSSLWKRRFGGDPDIVGKTIILSDQEYTVI